MTGKKKFQSSVWRKKKDTVVCLLGARFWQLRPEKKDTVICLAGCAVVLFFVVAGNFDYDQKKKDTVVCWREIGSFCVVAGNFHYDRKKKYTLRPEKKDPVVCLMGARFWRLRPEKKDTVICLKCGRFWQLGPEL